LGTQSGKEESTVRATISAATSASVTMLVVGTMSLVTSLVYDSSILTFIGLGLVFWGAVLLYIKPEEYTRKTLLEAALSPLLITLGQMIQELGYKGDAIYLPPKYFANPETTRIWISTHKQENLPTPEETQLYEDQPTARTTQGLLLTPPGINLSRLLEKSLGKSFIKTDLKSLEQKLPELFIEKLEIAENLELEEENDASNPKEGNPVSLTHVKNTTIHARITKPIYGNIVQEAEDPSQPAGSFICPVRSAIAIAITKATGKPVRMLDTRSYEDGNVIEASFEIVEE
jgi:uncharacterized membrane protein